MKKVFAYIFYSMTKFYLKWDGKKGIVAVCGVSMIQTLLLADLCIFLMKFYFEQDEIKPYSKIVSYFFGLFFFILSTINEYYYKNKYDKFRLYWKDETDSQKISRGFLVVVSLIVPWVLLFFIMKINKT
ncbi:hypothetical protein ACHMWN_07745 [Pedobacter sp. UC225_61]|uniref:hypothetical protein n=1 Tax=Pedobacter sp. UC225_61 TaxID=3374623 RepID=UPI00378E0A13